MTNTNFFSQHELPFCDVGLLHDKATARLASPLMKKQNDDSCITLLQCLSGKAKRDLERKKTFIRNASATRILTKNFFNQKLFFVFLWSVLTVIAHVPLLLCLSAQTVNPNFAVVMVVVPKKWLLTPTTEFPLWPLLTTSSVSSILPLLGVRLAGQPFLLNVSD